MSTAASWKARSQSAPSLSGLTECSRPKAKRNSDASALSARRRTADARIIGNALEKRACISLEMRTTSLASLDAYRGHVPTMYLLVSVTRSVPGERGLVNETSEVLRLEHVSPFEKLRRQAARLSTFKRRTLWLRTMTASLRSFRATASKALPPPGRLVMSSCHVTRGPSAPRMTFSSVIRGESFAYA